MPTTEQEFRERMQIMFGDPETPVGQLEHLIKERGPITLYYTSERPIWELAFADGTVRSAFTMAELIAEAYRESSAL